jgi:hypothetical protein
MRKAILVLAELAAHLLRAARAALRVAALGTHAPVRVGMAQQEAVVRRDRLLQIVALQRVAGSIDVSEVLSTSQYDE